MPTVTDTVENKPWDPIDTDLSQSTLNQSQEASAENARRSLEAVLDQRRAARGLQLGRELTPLEEAEIRDQVLGEIGSPTSLNDNVTNPEFPLTGNPALDQMLRQQSEGKPSGNKKRQEEMEKSFRQPDDLNELMKSISMYEPDFAHDFPLLYKKVRINKNGESEEVEVINEANFLRWIRHRMMFFEGEAGPDTPIDYFSKMGIPFGNRNISMNHLLEDDEKFFTDQDGAVHAELAQQIRRELFVRSIVRGRDINYRTGGSGMSDEGGIEKIMQSIFRDNNMTRNTWNGKSMWHWLLEMPYEVKPDGVTHENGHTKYEHDDRKQDSRLGRAIATGIAGYYHLADYTKLKEMIGEDSGFFTRDGFVKARVRLAEEETKANPFAKSSELEQKFVSDEELDKIFDSKGEVKNPDAFIKYINFFPDAAVDPRKLGLIRGMMQEAIAHKYKLYIRNADGSYKMEVEKDAEGNDVIKKDRNGNGVIVLDRDSMKIAEDYAFLTTRWTGIATRNDLGGTAYDAQAKWLRFKNYREKLAGPSKGGMFGNMYNVGMFKTLGVNYLDSIRNQEGVLVREMIENLATQVPLYEVTEKDIDAEGNPSETAKNKLEEENTKARQILSGLTFPDLQELSYYNNGVMRWVQEYKSFIGGEELHIDKLVTAARTGGVLYDPATFGKQIQEGFLKPLRYGYQGWPNLYSKTVRDIVKYDPTIHGDAPKVNVNGVDHIFKDMSLADSMFGEQLIDRDVFWMQLPKLDSKGRQIMKKEKDGTTVPVYQELQHIIDPKRIEKGSVQMFKQMALGRVAADIYSHIDRSSPYEKWDGNTIMHLINALEIIPGEVLVDEHDLKNTLVPKFFFTQADIRWLRSIAHASEDRQAAVGIAKDGGRAALGVAKGFFQAFFKSLK